MAGSLLGTVIFFSVSFELFTALVVINLVLNLVVITYTGFAYASEVYSIAYIFM